MPKAILPIFLIVVVDVLGLTIILPLLPFYAEKLGASPTVVGLLISSYAACQLVGGPLLGRISDRTGRRPLLLVSQAGTLLGFLILAKAETLFLVFVSRIIDGLTAGNLSLAQAYISDVTRPEDRTKSFAVIGVAFGLGFLVGPAISGYLAQFGYHYPVYAAAGLSATSILATYFLLPESNPSQTTDRKLSVLDWGAYATYFRRPAMGSLLWQFCAFIFSFSTFMSGFALFAERRFTWDGHPFGPKEVGYVFAYIGVLGVILQGGLIGRMVKAFGDWKLVRWSFVICTIGFIALGFTYEVPALLVVAGATSMGQAVLRPALTSLITQVADRSEIGSVLGLTQSLMSVAQIVAPFVAGLLIEHGMLASWAGVAAAASLVGLIFRKPEAVRE